MRDNKENSHLAHGDLEEHVAGALHSEELAGDPDEVRTELVGCAGGGRCSVLAKFGPDESLQRRRHVDVRRCLLHNRL